MSLLKTNSTSPHRFDAFGVVELLEEKFGREFIEHVSGYEVEGSANDYTVLKVRLTVQHDQPDAYARRLRD